MTSRKGQGMWTHLSAAILLVISIIVVVLIFTGTVGKARKDISQCKGILDFGKESKGACVPSAAACESQGGTAVTTFSGGCPDTHVCCVKTGDD